MHRLRRTLRSLKRELEWLIRDLRDVKADMAHYARTRKISRMVVNALDEADRGK